MSSGASEALWGEEVNGQESTDMQQSHTGMQDDITESTILMGTICPFTAGPPTPWRMIRAWVTDFLFLGYTFDWALHKVQNYI